MMPGPNCVKNPRDISDVRCSTSFTRRLVEDPIKVVIPARIQMKLSGIIYLEAARRKREDIADKIGINITTTGVLFINMETPKAIPKTAAKVRRGARSSALLMVIIGPSRAPVWNMPCPTTNKAMIVMSAGAAKPDRIAALSNPFSLSGEKKWKKRSSVTIIPTDIDSIENFSLIYSHTAMRTIPKVVHICQVELRDRDVRSVVST